jgi:hypothetical protein
MQAQVNQQLQEELAVRETELLQLRQELQVCVCVCVRACAYLCLYLHTRLSEPFMKAETPGDVSYTLYKTSPLPLTAAAGERRRPGAAGRDPEAPGRRGAHPGVCMCVLVCICTVCVDSGAWVAEREGAPLPQASAHVRLQPLCCHDNDSHFCLTISLTTLPTNRHPNPPTHTAGGRARACGRAVAGVAPREGRGGRATESGAQTGVCVCAYDCVCVCMVDGLVAWAPDGRK